MTITKRTNTKKETEQAVKKSYVIKVTFPNKSYRHFRFPGTSKLRTLHDMIMIETDFDDAHLHSFFMDVAPNFI